MSWEQDTDKLVGSSLRELRMSADLTQEGLAERLAAISVPMSQQTIAKIESGSRSLRLSEAVAIVQALDDNQGNIRLEHLVATPAELVIEQESRRIMDRVLAASSQVSAAAKEYTLNNLAGASHLEEAPDADGPASAALRYLTENGADGLFNIVKAGVRRALEEGLYSDEPTYRDIPDHAKPFLDAIGGPYEPAT